MNMQSVSQSYLKIGFIELSLQLASLLTLSLFVALPASALEPGIIDASIAPLEAEQNRNIFADQLQRPTPDPEDLKFREMFQLPIGPRELMPSEKLLRLDGRRVRMVGYMVDQKTMRSFILAPLPLKLGDEDESLADDLPPGVVFIHFAEEDTAALRHIPGLLELTGTLRIGNFVESDGRVSAVRLTLASTTSQEFHRHDHRQ
jgi:hypothetical protein